MALKATIFRVGLTLSDLDRHRYESHRLTLARHPSETDERLMVRVLAFALEADQDLAFGTGLSSDDEPALWVLRPDARIEHWIEVGLPDPKRLRQALGRAERVTLYSYGGSKSDLWWQRNRPEIAGLARPVRVVELAEASTRALAALARRDLELTVTIQDGRIWVADNADGLVEITPEERLPAEPARA
ncbi:MAG: YaeQ family protein [Gammaproteobacteria bacterium]|nr:YaeQ family protein [Gammaproteobacteria bacterium]